MANCCICGAKIPFMSNCYLDNNHRTCDECFVHIQNIYAVSDTDMDIVYKSRQWIEERLTQVDDSTAELLKFKLKESISFDAKRKSDIEKKQVEEERLKIEQDVNKNYNEKLKTFKTTTGYNFEGYRIIEYKNIVSSEIVLGTGFFTELSASMSDSLGIASPSYGGKLSEAKDTVLRNVIKNSMYLKANALIGINFDIMTIGHNMIVVSVTGTAVTIEEINNTNCDNAN